VFAEQGSLSARTGSLLCSVFLVPPEDNSSPPFGESRSLRELISPEPIPPMCGPVLSASVAPPGVISSPVLILFFLFACAVSKAGLCFVLPPARSQSRSSPAWFSAPSRSWRRQRFAKALSSFDFPVLGVSISAGCSSVLGLNVRWKSSRTFLLRLLSYF
jgi:hypothetical protein